MMVNVILYYSEWKKHRGHVFSLADIYQRQQHYSKNVQLKVLIASHLDAA